MAEVHWRVLLSSCEGVLSQMASSFQRQVVQRVEAVNSPPNRRWNLKLVWQKLDPALSALAMDLVKSILQSPKPSPLVLHGVVDLAKLLEIVRLPTGDRLAERIAASVGATPAEQEAASNAQQPHSLSYRFSPNPQSRAPAGGVEINGETFAGGEFIPNSESADPPTERPDGRTDGETVKKFLEKKEADEFDGLGPVESPPNVEIPVNARPPLDFVGYPIDPADLTDEQIRAEALRRAEEIGHRQKRRGNLQKHQKAISDRADAIERSLKNERAAALKRRGDAAAFEKSLGAAEKVAMDLKAAKGKLTAEINEITRLQNLGSRARAEKLGVKLAELNAELKQLENLEKLPPGSLVASLQKLLGSKSESVSEFAKSALKNLGKFAIVGGFVVRLLVFNDRAAEAGVVRATIEVLPVVGDAVTITQQMLDLRKSIYGLVRDNQKLADLDEETASIVSRGAQNLAVAALKRVQAKLPISNPDYVDLEGVGDALRRYKDSAASILLRMGAGSITPHEAEAQIRALDKVLEEDLRGVLHQNEPESKTDRPLF